MAFTEFSAPVQYEYKPLNLSAFMVPLAKMQEQYDAVEAAVSSSTVDLDALNWGTDKERAKELKETYGQKVTELAKNLAETKNYKQAAIKLKELQNTWLKDPEKRALESNYKLVQEAVKEQKERIGKSLANNGITQGQFDQWYRDLKDRYEGLGGADFKASYEDPEGKYNIAERTARLADMTEELEKVKFEAAKAVPGQTVEGVLQSAGYDTETMDKKFMKTTIDEKNKDVIAKRVVDYVSQLPRFKPWLKEVEYYDFKDLKQDPERFQEAASSLNTRYINSLNQQIQGLESAAKKNPKLLETQDYKDLLEDRDAAVKAQKSGEYDPNVIASLYAVDYENKMYNADALGALLAYKNVKRDYDWRKLHIPDDGSGSGSGGAGAQDGYFIPDTEEKASITSLNTTKIKAGEGLYSTVGKINNLVGGVVRNVVMGEKGSAEYNRLSKDPNQIRAKQSQLLTAFTQTMGAGGDATKFRQLAAQKGITMSIGQAQTLFKNLSKPGNREVTDFKAELDKSREISEQYDNSEKLLNSIEESVSSTKEFQKDLYEAGTTVFTPMGVSPNIEKKFIGATYSDADFKKAGINRSNRRSYLTFEEVAKLSGYKSFGDAIKKGFNFYGVSMESPEGGFLGAGKAITPKEYYNTLISSGHYKSTTANEMGFRYVNNKNLDKQMSKYFLSVEDLKTFQPAYANNWNQVPGFRPDDSDVKLNITENRAPKLVVQGNQLLYEVPITYKDDSGAKKEGTVKLKTKQGMGVRQDAILKDLDIASSARETTADIQTNDMIKVARFNNKFKDNPLSNSLVKSVNVTNGGTPKEISSIPYGTKSRLQVEKVWAGGTNPVLKVAIVDENTGKKAYLNGESGKPWYVNANSNGAADAAKAIMMRALGE
jgi:hypothetical protein